jgi:hypothetical protein
MHRPLVFASDRIVTRDSVLYGRRLSIVRFSAAIALVVTTITAAFVQDAGSGPVRCCVSPSSQFSSGMPLP